MAIEYTIIIPAYNEEELLPKTLEALKAAMDAVDMSGEVVLVDNNSTDGTARIAKEFGARVVFEKVNQISRARNAGAKVAQGKYFVFLDADTILSPELLKAALGELAGGKCCGGGTVVDFGGDLPFLLRKLGGFWNWFSRTMRVAAGCFVYCLREGYEHVGGFSERVYASEEIWFTRSLRKWGKKRGLKFKVLTLAPVVTSARKIEWFSSVRLFMTLFVMTLFPFLIFSKTFCNIWYWRPKKKT